MVLHPHPRTEVSGEDPGDPDATLRGRGAGIRPALIAALVVAVTAGALFGAVQLSKEVARTSAELHLADEAARAATVIRSHVALAAIGSVEQQRLSAAEATTALGELRGSLGGLHGSEPAQDAIAAGFSFADTSGEVVGAIGSGTVDQEAVDLRFREVMAELDELRVALIEHIDFLGSSYNLLGIVLGVATVGLAPLVLVLWTRSITNKTMEVRELSLRLKHETELRDAHNSVLRMVVHEFRTPLTGISGLAAMLEVPSVRRSSEGREMVTMIRNEAEDMSQLTDDILTSAGLETGHLEIRLEPVDIAEATTRTVTMFDRRWDGIEVSCDPGLALADELRVRQILKNLISNAMKYGGSTVRVTGSVEGDWYVLRVADDGPGVPDDIRDRLFEPFPHRGSGAPSQSVGLGLFIVRQLAEAMKGTVTYQSSDDEEAVFTVRLPMASPHDTALSLASLSA
ncbi:MAG TPA: HAMP domain-containing sensor histidine kinase [Acidimicrobiia bacterium]|jgi:signal transduction histidine kinase